MADQLGAFGAIWEAWDEAHDEIVAKPLSHFQRAIDLQYVELDHHLKADDRAAAVREAVDVISIGLNTLRKLGCRPDEVAEVARARAKDRMQGQALAILDKYERLYGI